MARKIWHAYKWWIVGVCTLVYALVFIILDALWMPTPAHTASIQRMNELLQLVRLHAGVMEGPVILVFPNAEAPFRTTIRFEVPVYGNKRLIIDDEDSLTHLVYVDENADGIIDTIIPVFADIWQERIYYAAGQSRGEEQDTFDLVVEILIQRLQKHAPI